MNKSLIRVDNEIVFYNDENFGKVVYDSYFNCYRSSHDNYKMEFGKQEDAVYALIEFTLKELNK